MGNGTNFSSSISARALRLLSMILITRNMTTNIVMPTTANVPPTADLFSQNPLSFSASAAAEDTPPVEDGSTTLVSVAWIESPTLFDVVITRVVSGGDTVEEAPSTFIRTERVDEELADSELLDSELLEVAEDDEVSSSTVTVTSGVEVVKDVEVGIIEDVGEEVRVWLSSVDRDSESDDELDSESDEADSVSDEPLLDSVEVAEEDSDSDSLLPSEVEVKSGSTVLSIDAVENEEVKSSTNTELDSGNVDVDESPV